MKKFLMILAVAFLILAGSLNTYAEETGACPNCGAKVIGKYCSECGHANSASMPELEAFEAYLTMKFTYEENVILAKYDVDVRVDGVCVGTVKQKETLEKMIVVKHGVHEITLCKDGEVKASIMMDVRRNAQLSCTLKAHMGSLELRRLINGSPASKEAAQAYRINRDYAQCVTVNYERFCRYPERFEDKPVHLRGVVKSFAESAWGTMWVVLKDKEGNPWNVKYRREAGEPRLLVGDTADIYGHYMGVTPLQKEIPSLPTVELEYLLLK